MSARPTATELHFASGALMALKGAITRLPQPSEGGPSGSARKPRGQSPAGAPLAGPATPVTLPIAPDG